MRFRRYSKKQFFIPVLAITDLSACVVNSVVLFLEVFFWVAFPYDVLCKIINFLAFVTTMTSTAILLLIALDRYEAFSKPLRMRNGLKRKKAFVGLIIIMSMIAAIPVSSYFGAAMVISEDGKLTGYRCRILYDHMLDFVYAFHVLWLAVGVGILIALSFFTRRYIDTLKSRYSIQNHTKTTQSFPGLISKAKMVK